MDKIASDRGRKSAEEFQKLLIVTSLGALGLFFSVLTKSVEPNLTNYQQYVSITAVLLLAVASAIGIYNWYLDAKINLIWSFALKEEDKSKKNNLYKQRTKLKKIENRLSVLFFSSYGLAMALGTLFLILRIFEA